MSTGDSVLCKLPYDVLLLAKYKDWITRTLSRGKFYEQAMLEYIRVQGTGLTIVDVGACIGTHTIYFAKVCKARRVISFEPNPEAFDYLADNVLLNSVESIVELSDRALSNAPGHGVMEDAFLENMGMARLALGDGAVVVSTLDEEMDRIGNPKIDILKIDVEGMPDKVLLGGLKTIATSRPRIFVECDTTQLRIEATMILDPLGYRRGGTFNPTPTYEFYIP